MTFHITCAEREVVRLPSYFSLPLIYLGLGEEVLSVVVTLKSKFCPKIDQSTKLTKIVVNIKSKYFLVYSRGRCEGAGVQPGTPAS